MSLTALRAVKKFRGIPFFLIGVLSVLAVPATQAAFVTGLSDTQIQNVLENYFPVSEYAAVARVSLHKPQVRLQKDNNSVVLIVPVQAKISGGEVRRGHATIQVNLAYKPSTGGLYFSQPKIQQFEIPGVDKKTLASLREIVFLISQNSLPLVRIYRVKERELNHSLAKSALKSVVIEEGRLRLEFGFN